MKNRLSKPMLAIMLAPFALTLMANSTAPFPFRNEYNDFTYTLVEQRYVEDPAQQADLRCQHKIPRRFSCARL